MPLMQLRNKSFYQCILLFFTVLRKIIFSFSFIPLLAIFSLIFFSVYSQDLLTSLSKKLFVLITDKLGWIFLLYGFSSFVILAWLAFGPFGKILLAKRGEKPEFTWFEWFFLLFCAGIGISVTVWGMVEPLYYLKNLPHFISDKENVQVEWAHMLPLFHWGLSAWAIYCLPCIPMAYLFHVMGEKRLSFGVLIERFSQKKMSPAFLKLCDLIVVFSILGGVGTSLGLVIPVISEIFQDLLGLTPSMTAKLTVLLMLSFVFTISTSLGMNKGLKQLSMFNAYLAIIFVSFVLFAGPSSFILSISTNSLGLLLDNFFRLSLNLDPITAKGWPQQWTIFYWAWWVAFTPMMAIFVARISRGRTIKELIFAQILAGSFGCWVILAVLGGYSLYLETNGILNLSQILAESGIEKTCLLILKSLPFPKIISLLYILLAFIFSATSLDSAAYILASVSSQNLSTRNDPSLASRVYWCFILTIFSACLVVLNCFEALKLSSLLVSLPMLPLTLFCLWVFIKKLKKQTKQLDQKESLKTEENIFLDKLSSYKI